MTKTLLSGCRSATIVLECLSITVIDEFTATGNNQHGTPLVTTGNFKKLTFIVGVPDFSATGDVDFDIQLSNGTWLQGLIANIDSADPSGLPFSGKSISLGTIFTEINFDGIIQAIRTDINIASISAPIYVQLQAEI